MKHPAKFSAPIIEELEDVIRYHSIEGIVFDGFAGVGGIHALANPNLITIGGELEPEFAAEHPDTIVTNALWLPFRDNTFDAYITSPAYGNRMADQYLGDPSGSIRHTYATYLGRKLTRDSGAALQWGRKYRSFHVLAWREAMRVTKPGMPFVVNISNHIRKGEEMMVTEWHEEALTDLGCTLMEKRRIATQRQGQGENGKLRCEYESVLVFANAA